MGSAIRTNAVRDDRKLLLLLLFAMRELVLQFLEPGVGEAHRLAFTELTSKSEAMEFDGLLAEARRMSLLPPTWIDLAPAQVRDLLVRPQVIPSGGVELLRPMPSGSGLFVHGRRKPRRYALAGLERVPAGRLDSRDT